MYLRRPKESGFILIISMLMLLVVTVLVVNSTRATIMSEKMAGGYMDRSRAMIRAEKAIAEVQRVLVSGSNGDVCRTGCRIVNVGSATVATAVSASATLPSAWNSGAAIDTTDAKAKINVAWLASSFLPSARASSCTPYSIISRGEGEDSRTSVVLQVVSFVCDVE